jgi:hypothetical protein
MATLNGIGQKIPDLTLLPEEAAHVRKIVSLAYPEKYEVLMRLNHEDFRTWLYGQDPLVQLVRSGDEHFKNLLKYQRSKSFWQKVFDAVWRWSNGFGY